MYTVDRRLYVNAKGKVVEEGDPSAAFLLAAPGHVLTDEEARRYGLLTPEPEAKAVDGPPTTKALPGPKTTKSGG